MARMIRLETDKQGRAVRHVRALLSTGVVVERKAVYTRRRFATDTRQWWTWICPWWETGRLQSYGQWADAVAGWAADGWAPTKPQGRTRWTVKQYRMKQAILAERRHDPPRTDADLTWRLDVSRDWPPPAPRPFEPG